MSVSHAVPLTNWPAARLTEMAADWLRIRFPGALIVPEFVCGALASARIDVAAITSQGIHGIEIKGDGDTHARLASQGPLFLGVCSTVRLLCSPNCPKILEHTPAGWGRFEIENGRLDDGGYPQYDFLLAPRQLLCTIWREELIALHIKFFGRKPAMKYYRGQSVAVLGAEVAENIPLKDIRAGVCATLRARDWSKPTMVNGPPRRILQAASAEPQVLSRADGQSGDER